MNKSMKDELKKYFHSWYAKQMQEQLKTVPVLNVKVDVSASIIKNNSMNWFIHAWQCLQAQPSIMDSGKLVLWILLLRLFYYVFLSESMIVLSK